MSDPSRQVNDLPISLSSATSSSSSSLLENLSYDDDVAHEALVRGLFPSTTTTEGESEPCSNNETSDSRTATGRTPTEDPTPYEGTRSTLTTSTTESHVSVSSGEVAEHTGQLPYLAAYLRKHPDASHFTKQHTSSSGRRSGGGRYWEKPADKTVCWVCLGSHDSSVCSRKRCFRCAQEGHGSAECSSTKWCTICRKQGHDTAQACPTAAYRTSLDPAYYTSLTCMVCGQKGHPLCGPHSRLLDSTRVSTTMTTTNGNTWREESTIRVHDSREYAGRNSSGRRRGSRSRSRERRSRHHHYRPDDDYRPVSSPHRDWDRDVRGGGGFDIDRARYEYPPNTPPPSSRYHAYQQYSSSPSDPYPRGATRVNAPTTPGSYSRGGSSRLRGSSREYTMREGDRRSSSGSSRDAPPSYHQHQYDNYHRTRDLVPSPRRDYNRYDGHSVGISNMGRGGSEPYTRPTPPPSQVHYRYQQQQQVQHLPPTGQSRYAWRY